MAAETKTERQAEVQQESQPSDDRLGYTKLWRKIWNNEWLVQPGHEFTRLEAWLDLVNNLATGTDTPELRRGDLVASDRFLAKRWSWSKSRVRRFKTDLVSMDMLKNSADHQADHQADRFTVSKYTAYNGERTAKRTAERTKLKKEKEGERLCSPNGEHSSVSDLLLKIYREENQKLPEVRALSEERKRKCLARIHRARSQGRLEEYLSDFRKAVAKAQNSAFLTGEGERGWKASFDWFVQNDTNLLKVLEGKYDGPANGQRGGRTHGFQNIDANGCRRTSRGEPFADL